MNRADPFETHLCGVCMKQRPAGECHRQFGGVGVWYCCDHCFEQHDRQQQERGQRFERPEPELKQGESEEVLPLWSEDE